jgi:crossover junction endodeoxyribonuclease RusA
LITLTLPWPAKELSPNARVHWAVKSGKTKRARGDAKYLCMNALGILGYFPIAAAGQKLTVAFTFHPKDRRRRDVDNLISSTKAHRDGIADALNIDDSHFRLTAEIGEPHKPAYVAVVIS